ncbi:hypothetical protein [Pseudomonas tolaasii]
MNEQLQQALLAILNKAMSGVEAGVSFLSAEIPDVIHQLLLWKIVSSSLLTLLGFCLLFASHRLIRRALRIQAEEAAKGWALQRGELYVATYILGGISGLVGSIMSIGNGLNALQIWIAPKIYLIEYAASLAK